MSDFQGEGNVWPPRRLLKLGFNGDLIGDKFEEYATFGRELKASVMRIPGSDGFKNLMT
jgi:hypothetical protein